MSEAASQHGAASWLAAPCTGIVFVAGVFFVYAGLGKAVDISAFAKVVESHNLLSASTSNLVALIMPWIEVVIGLALVQSIARGGSGLHRWTWFVALAFVVFAAYTAALWMQPPPNPTSCGCGFSSRAVDDWRLPLARNVSGFAILSVCAVVLSRHAAFRATSAQR